MTILITGAGPNGVTGRLIKESLQGFYSVLSPGSNELDLTDSSQVSSYFDSHKIDQVIHCATFRPLTANKANFVNDELESNLRMYFNLAAQADKVEKIIYFGSGAEFDKTRDIVNIEEDAFGSAIPKDRYGFAKYVMNRHAITSDNIYNIRLFGTISPYERYTKNVVSNLCVKAAKNLPLELRRDCCFSFVYMPDVLKVINFMLTKTPKYHDYNIVMPQSCLLSEIAEMIRIFSGSNREVRFQENGLNREYTASNTRIISETGIKFTSLDKAVRVVYDHYARIADAIDLEDIDARWRK